MLCPRLALVRKRRSKRTGEGRHGTGVEGDILLLPFRLLPVQQLRNLSASATGQARRTVLGCRNQQDAVLLSRKIKTQVATVGRGRGSSLEKMIPLLMSGKGRRALGVHVKYKPAHPPATLHLGLTSHTILRTLL